ncbi:MAG: TonB-dependent receptor [Sphingomonadaceae bacterium]|nr:TonB-dependent receptor [Sphingomonadaceae bacterium]
MSIKSGMILAGSILVCGVAPSNPARAQVADDNVLAESEDAFGTKVGLESTGIYSDRNTRGFSPLDAGNARIDGIYFDQVSFLTFKLKQTTAIRVGFGAVTTPFVAPTGVVDHQMRPFPEAYGQSVAYTRFYYGGTFLEHGLRLPIMGDKIALTGGLGFSESGQADGAMSHSWAVTVRPIFRFGRFQFVPFYGGGEFTRSDAKPLAVVTDGYVPKVPPASKYLGQKWARGKRDHGNYGATLRGSLSDHLYFRGGLFKSDASKSKNFSEIYRVEAEDGRSTHSVFADPAHDNYTTSGEGIFVLHYTDEKSSHRFYAGYRARDRYTETGGSDFFDLGTPIHGTIDQIAEPDFEFTGVNKGSVRQSSWMAAYVGILKNLGSINIGVQKAQYRASLFNGTTELTDRSRADPWLYNAALHLKLTRGLSAYVATQRGLEDSGIAPGNAANRDEQLPSTKSTQYEGGLRWDFGKGQAVLAAFEITKPYFSFDEDRNFVAIGEQRHRGVEVSLAGHFTKRFDILVGGVMMDPSVTGPGRGAGLVGPRPAGVPKFYGRLDANYRTGLPSDLTLTASIEYEGARPATSKTFDRLDGDQKMLPSVMVVNLGTRHLIHIDDKTNIGVRILVQNVFDDAAWYVAAPDVLTPKKRRSVLVVASLDF